MTCENSRLRLFEYIVLLNSAFALAYKAWKIRRIIVRLADSTVCTNATEAIQARHIPTRKQPSPAFLLDLQSGTQRRRLREIALRHEAELIAGRFEHARSIYQKQRMRTHKTHDSACHFFNPRRATFLE